MAPGMPSGSWAPGPPAHRRRGIRSPVHAGAPALRRRSRPAAERDVAGIDGHTAALAWMRRCASGACAISLPSERSAARGARRALALEGSLVAKRRCEGPIGAGCRRRSAPPRWRWCPSRSRGRAAAPPVAVGAVPAPAGGGEHRGGQRLLQRASPLSSRQPRLKSGSRTVDSRARRARIHVQQGQHVGMPRVDVWALAGVFAQLVAKTASRLMPSAAKFRLFSGLFCAVVSTRSVWPRRQPLLPVAPLDAVR